MNVSRIVDKNVILEGIYFPLFVIGVLLEKQWVLCIVIAAILISAFLAVYCLYRNRDGSEDERKKNKKVCLYMLLSHVFLLAISIAYLGKCA